MWTEEDIEKLKRGIVPETHTLYTCYWKARTLGFIFHNANKSGRWWSDDEIEMLRRGEVPPNRIHTQCYLKAKQLGFRFHKAKCCHRKWSDAENQLLRQGIIPEGRTCAQCHTHALYLGFTFHRKDSSRRTWTKEENELLKAGTIPEGRSRKNAFTHAIMLGCADKLRQRTKPGTRILTETELKLLRQNKVPDGITLQQARYLATTHGIPSYRPKQTELIERRNSRGRKIVQMRKNGMSTREIAERMGISIQYVYKLENLYNKTTK